MPLTGSAPSFTRASSPRILTPVSRQLWLRILSTLLVDFHNSIRVTHGNSLFPAAFADLNTHKQPHIELLNLTLSSFSQFFTDYKADPKAWDICLRCLEECHIPIDNAKWGLVLKSCSQNIRAAHSTIVNNAIRTLHQEAEAWRLNQSERLCNDFIRFLTDSGTDVLEVSADPRFKAWINTTGTRLQSQLRSALANTTITEILEPWATAAFDDAKAQQVIVLDQRRKELERITAEEISKAKEAAQIRATVEAKAFFGQQLDIRTKQSLSDVLKLEAELREAAEVEISAFKHALKIQVEERKKKLHSSLIPTSSSPSSISSQPVVCTNRPRKHVDPTSRPLPRSRSTSCSRPESRPPGWSPDMATPRASSVTELPPTRALTEPALGLSLEPPPTNVSVGPPSNSWEEAMMKVDETNLVPVEYPPNPSALEIPGLPDSVAASPQPPQSAGPSASAVATDPATSAVLSAIERMSSQLSSITSRLDKLEQPSIAPYLPSRLAGTSASIWAPPCSHCPTPGDQVFVPCDESWDDSELPMWEYSNAPFTGDFNMTLDDPFASSHLEPADDWPESYLKSLYKDRFRIAPSSAFTDGQKTDVRALPGIFQLFTDHEHLPFNQALDGATISRFWKFRDFHLNNLSSAAAEKRLDHTATGSVPPFPGRAPSQPPTTTLNPVQPPTPPEDDPSLPWFVMGKGGKGKPLSFAAAAAPKPKAGTTAAPSIPIPLQKPRDLTRAELDGFSCDQLINAIESRFNSRVQVRTASKKAYIDAYLRQLRAEPQGFIPMLQAAPPPPQPQRPKPRPVVTSEFTVTMNPSTVALRGPKGDPAAIVRSLQTAIRQSFQGNKPSVTLLSGRWSSQLLSNFVLMFAGQPSNDAVFCLRSVLLSPFQPGASLVPQWGYTRVIVHSVPIVLDDKGSRPLSDDLVSELSLNEACKGLRVINPPKWLKTTIGPEKIQSSIIFSFLDEDGSRLARLTASPLFLFGSPCAAKLFNSLPLVCQCDRCHRLGHSADRCHQPKDVIICFICGNRHAAKDHAFRCPTSQTHTTQRCSCAPQCINCRAVHFPAAGHLARDLSCPLRKKFWRDNNRTGVSPDEDSTQPMVVDASAPPIFPVPSLRPTDDEQVVLRPASLAQVEDTPPPPPLPPSCLDPPLQIAAILADIAKWRGANASVFHSASRADLTSLPPHSVAHAWAYELGINLDTLIQSMPNA